jgi:hypothetical protein
MQRRNMNIPIALQLMNTKGQAEETNSAVALASVAWVLRLPGLASTFPYLKWLRALFLHSRH